MKTGHLEDAKRVKVTLRGSEETAEFFPAFARVVELSSGGFSVLQVDVLGGAVYRFNTVDIVEYSVVPVGEKFSEEEIDEIREKFSIS